MRKIFFFFFAALLSAASAGAQFINPDSTAKAMAALQRLQVQLKKNLSDPGTDKAAVLQKMLDVGMWDEAYEAIRAQDQSLPEYRLLLADYYILNNDFKEAETLVSKVLEQDKNNEKALLKKAFLAIQAWQLPEAADICEQAIARNASADMQLMLGRVHLLQKNYPAALAIAKRLIAADTLNAGAYLLEADVCFWDQHPELAKAPLRRSLEIDPFNADARFSYGYAIWRRIDATQLNAMAAQWELALAINPLHFQTHWHWGNGHTNLTYADYSEKDDDAVRNELKKADEAVRQNDMEKAISITRQVAQKYPSSVIPLMYRGSFYYMYFDMDRKIRLDSAEHIFRKILDMKKHYGPAHNGLSAVIKSKRIPYLASFDSISYSLSHTRISDPDNFRKVFTDMTYYPGDMVQSMVWNQMYTAVVYFPFLSKQGLTFHVPPLHIDLAIAMNASFFRYGTTFDNRQWMDIRGVGSGAAAIEYVERGAFEERNVVLHEFVHLFHGSVLTDEENRQVRALYYHAMKENRTLDYYSQNNESEYFAQTFPAYFEPVKVHPLDFKSMNTTADLRSKDPDMYAFIDKLVKKHRAYLQGDKKAMAGNWAQVYLNLSNGTGSDLQLAAAYLDTSLQYDAAYLPAMIAYAGLERKRKNFKEAENWLEKAKKTDPAYAPVYVAWASLYRAKKDAGVLEQETAFREQMASLKKAAALEKDYQEAARIAGQIRDTYREHALIAEALAAAEAYAKNGPSVSTYLRDRRDDAAAFAASLRCSLGYVDALQILKKLVEQKPQNFGYRNYYADALALANRYEAAIQTLQEAQRILSASGSARSDYYLRMAEYYHHMEKEDSARSLIKSFQDHTWHVAGGDKLRYARLLAVAGYPEQAAEYFRSIPSAGEPYYAAEYYFTQGILQQESNRRAESTLSFEKAISINPYLVEAYKALGENYKQDKALDNIHRLKAKLQQLPFRPAAALIQSVGR